MRSTARHGARRRRLPGARDFRDPDLAGRLQQVAMLLEAQRALSSSAAHAPMLKTRTNLPACGSRAELLSALDTSQSVVVCGETGCGKSTQVPQFILDAEPKSRIIVTQPRRNRGTSPSSR